MAHRVLQAFDTAQFIKSTRGYSTIQILAGDLNTEPGDLAYRILVSTSKLIDSFDGVKYIGTNECAKNSYTNSATIKNLPNGKRIDYIMYGNSDRYKTKVIEHKLPFPNKVPGHDFSYSDHEGVTTRLEIIPSVVNVDKSVTDSCSEKSETVSLEESIKICNLSLRKLESDRTTYIMYAATLLVILFIVIDIQFPYVLKTFNLLLKICLCGAALFFLFMATLWNYTERHGILSGKLSMEIVLRNLKE